MFCSPLPHLEYSGVSALEPLNVGYLRWHLLALDTFVFRDDRQSFLCRTGVRASFGPNWYADLDVRVPGDPLGRRRAFRIFHFDSGREIAFQLESFARLEAEGVVNELVTPPAPFAPPRIQDRLVLTRGEPVATLTIRCCRVPGCDHSSCGQ